MTLRVREGLPSLRNQSLFADVFAALRAARNRFGFRLTQFSVQSNHIHMIVEATGRPALSRGMQGLGVRLARAINTRLRRAGKVFADRYHDRILKSLREVRNALEYVLKNARRHGIYHDGVDPCSSGDWFDGWKDLTTRDPATTSAMSGVPPNEAPIVAPRGWMLGVGWKRLGLIPVRTRPAGAARAGASGYGSSRLREARSLG